MFGVCLSVCLSVCLLATLRTNYATDRHEKFITHVSETSHVLGGEYHKGKTGRIEEEL